MRQLIILAKLTWLFAQHLAQPSYLSVRSVNVAKHIAAIETRKLYPI